MPDDRVRGLPVGPGVELLLDMREENPWYYTQGTSFPPYPRLYEQCFRTDIRGGMMFRWSGTYWLSEQLFTIDFGIYTATTGFFAYGELNVLALPRDLDVYIVSCHIDAQVETTNDGTHYWNVALRYGTVNNTWTDLVVGSTSPFAIGAWRLIAANPAVNTLLDTTGTADANIHGLVGYADKINTPGNAYASLNVSFRLRAT